MEAAQRIGARLRQVADAAAAHGVDALFVSPGPDLRFLLEYDAVPLERLTCLMVPGGDRPVLVVPRLEEPAALASGAGAAIADGIVDLRVWEESEDPYAIVADAARTRARPLTRVAVDDRMWAAKAIALRGALGDIEQRAAGGILAEARETKDVGEIDALEQAAQAIDRVHARVPSMLRAGRTEREVAADIAGAILEEGHVRVDFVIVAAGPHGASPHHEPSDRPIGVGEPIVVDIGGTMPSGYCSDETRMYSIGDPPEDFLHAYACLHEAHSDAVAAVSPGVIAGDVDAAARDTLARGGLAEFFIHRTGHGIGLETHEEPYIMSGSDLSLRPGMVFSIEPGFYLPGRFGARIEDIVVCTADGVRSLTRQPRDLVVVPADDGDGRR